MVRTVWFILKLGALVALVVWLAEQTGQVEITWMGYDIHVHIGVFLVGLVALILVGIFVYNLIDTFVGFPASWRRYREVCALENGYRAVSLGLTSVAAGDMKAAGRHAKRARKLMPDDTGLPLLLEAQAARLEGREEDALASFTAMLENKETAFLGVRGLLQAAMDQEDYVGGLEIARKALAVHPKQPWILKMVYDLEIQNSHWDAALTVLKTLGKTDSIEAAQVRVDQAVLHLVLGIEAEGSGLDAEALAFWLIEKGWKHTPHPDLARLWMEAIAANKREDKSARMRAAERLVKMRGDHVEGYLAVAREAIAQGLWGQAREVLAQALAIESEHDVRVYEMRGRLETQAGDFEAAAAVRAAMPADTLPAPCWVCGETGRIYADWHWFATPRLFGTMAWARPEVTPFSVAALDVHSDDTPASLASGTEDQKSH